MCIFTSPVKDVSSTCIFTRPSDEGRQILVYRMNLSTSTDVAMVLPLPVPSGSPEDSVRFIDIADYPKFFDDLDLAFPRRYGARQAGHTELRLGVEPTRLVVHKVGSFEASFVPNRHDFSRLDPRFRLPDHVWQALPAYEDWGFAVFKLGPLASLTGIHPMAFEFPRRQSHRLFFPTVHVHAGRVEPWAIFDHWLYCQGVDEATLERWYWAFHSARRWETSSASLSEVIAVERAAGIPRLDRPCHRVALTGSYPNVDVVI